MYVEGAVKCAAAHTRLADSASQRHMDRNADIDQAQLSCDPSPATVLYSGNPIARQNTMTPFDILRWQEDREAEAH